MSQTVFCVFWNVANNFNIAESKSVGVNGPLQVYSSRTVNELSITLSAREAPEPKPVSGQTKSVQIYALDFKRKLVLRDARL